MKYTFDLNFNGDSYNLRIETVYNKNLGFGASKTFTIGADSDSIENVLGNLIDEMRLTLQERNDARRNASVFIDWIKYLHSQPQNMILEETDVPNEENGEKINDDELINSVLEE